MEGAQLPAAVNRLEPNSAAKTPGKWCVLKEISPNPAAITLSRAKVRSGL